MLEVKLKKFNDNNQFFNESFKESKPFGDFVAILNEEKELNIFYYKEIIETSNNFHQLVPIPESKIPDITSYFWGRIHETMIILLALDKNYIVHLYRIILPKAKINLSNSEIFEIHEIKTEYSRKTARKGLIHFFEEDPQKITNQNQSESAQIHVFKTQIQPDYLHQALGKPTTNPYERDLKSLAIVDLISAKNQSLNTLLILSSNVAVICKITENHFYGVEMFILSGEKNKIIPFVQFRRKQDFLYALCEKGKSIHIWDISHAQKVAILKISKIAFFKKIKFKIEKNCIQFDVTQNNSKLVICYSNRFLFVLDLDEYFFNYQNQLGISLIKPQKFPYVFQDPKDQVFDLYQHLHKKFVPPNDAFCSLDSYLFDKDDPNQDPELEISKQKFDSDIHQEWLIGKHVYEQKVCGMFVEMRKMRSAFVFHWPHLIENRDCSSEFQPSWSNTHQDPSLRSGQHLQYHHENKICTILALINNSITIISPKKFHHVSKKKPKLFLGKFLLLNSQVLLCYSDKNPVSVTDRRDLCSSAFLLNLDHLNQQKFPISSISFNEPTFIYGELNKNFFSVISRSGINAVVLGFTESQIKKNIAMFHSNQSTQFIAKINNWVLGSYDDTLLENALTKQDFQSIDEMIQSQKTQEQIIKFLTQMFALLQEKQLATFDPNFLEDVFVKSRARLVEIIRNIVSESNENLENKFKSERSSFSSKFTCDCSKNV
ncbi:hypothetical protein M0811_12483 [Anaeramoeba ignava]|uniref:Uncharacterized protein n=1 Tax=Anaeramoeba ignava TaxID=1746090 RepID=A0A9Q0L8C3_ANAIG|nr:hypothetical protein M0811_12483 [Anaeramoeba ignava]